MKENQEPKEQFKTSIGGQALIEGILMRGPEKDAIVVRGADGLTVEVTDRKLNPKGSWKNLPFIRGIFNFFDAQVVGVKALMRSADLAPEEMQEEPGKFDLWLEKKLGSERFQKALVGIAVAMGLCLSIALFFLLPMTVASFFDKAISSILVLNLLEGLIRMVIFLGYMLLISRMKEMRRVFSYHGAEHKTIRCYEAGAAADRGECPENDPFPPPLRNQLPVGDYGHFHSDFLHCVLAAADPVSGAERSAGQLRLPVADDRL